ncbi:MAG: DUF2185 domain-containing protein [Bacilli bacterium]|nr:DUF2185 domain-containing protein [Bacilli bacterium]
MNMKERCLVTDKVSVEGKKIGYMYREQPYNIPNDSGWRFFEGTEDEDYINDPENSTAYTLEEVINMDNSIKPFLDSPYGSSYYKDKDGNFIEENNGEDY